MKFDQLKYFVETAKRQHIGLAAKFLHISPSAIGHSLAALEEELGKNLFEKQGRQIKLTHHGKLLLERAEFLLLEMERMREDLSTDQVKMRGHYRIAATHTLSSEFLTPAWITLQNEHSSLTATLQSLRSGEILSRVGSGELDLGFCFSPQPSPHCEQELLHKGRLLLCFGKHHPFLKTKNVTDLQKYSSIAALAVQGIDNCEDHPSLKKLGVRPKVVNLFDSYDVAISALKLNSLWALLPDFLIHRHSNDLETYIPRNWEAEYKIVALWPKFRVRTQTLDCLIEEMKRRVI